MQRFAQMQASDIDIYRNEIRKTKNEMVCTSLASRKYASKYSACIQSTGVQDGVALLLLRQPLVLVYLSLCVVSCLAAWQLAAMCMLATL